MEDQEIVEKLRRLSLLEAEPIVGTEYKALVRHVLKALGDRSESHEDEIEELEARVEELQEEAAQRDEELVRMSLEAQRAVNEANRRNEHTIRSLEAQLVEASDQKSGVESVVLRLQRENQQLRGEIKLLRCVDGKKSAAAKVLTLQAERNSYRTDYRKVLDELDTLKQQRAKELESVLAVCRAFETKIQEISRVHATILANKNNVNFASQEQP